MSRVVTLHTACLQRSHALVLCLLLLLGFTPQLSAQGTRADSDHEASNATESDQSSQRGHIKDLPRDIAKDSLQLFSRSNLVPWMIGVTATAATHPEDAEFHEYFATPRLGHVADETGTRLGGPLIAVAVGGLFVVSRFHGSDEFAHFSYDLTEASLLNGLLTTSLKYAVQRTRPSGGNYSFPSGHTSAAFAAATVIDHYYGWKTSLAAYATATFVGISRIDVSKHYLSDVVAGATIGYISGRTVTRGSKTKHAFLWAPIVSPSSETVGIAIVWEPHHDSTVGETDSTH